MSNPTDIVAQMIRAYEGKGVAAGTFAEAILSALEKAGYTIERRAGQTVDGYTYSS